MPAWKPPLIIAACAVSIVGGFYLGGPGLGMAVGALAAASIVVLAIRDTPRGPIVPAALRDLKRHVLLVASAAPEDPRTLAEIAELCRADDGGAVRSEVRVLMPLRTGFLGRWSGERNVARELAQRECVLLLASLAKAGLAASSSLGDEDVVLAVEDELRTYPATEVILVSGVGAEDPGEVGVAEELRARLQAEFLHLCPPEGRSEGAHRRRPQSLWFAH